MFDGCFYFLHSASTQFLKRALLRWGPAQMRCAQSQQKPHEGTESLVHLLQVTTWVKYFHHRAEHTVQNSVIDTHDFYSQVFDRPHERPRSEPANVPRFLRQYGGWPAASKTQLREATWDVCAVGGFFFRFFFCFSFVLVSLWLVVSLTKTSLCFLPSKAVARSSNASCAIATPTPCSSAGERQALLVVEGHWKCMGFVGF